MAMAERPFSILKVIVAAQFFSSCYFQVELLHNVTISISYLNTVHYYVEILVYNTNVILTVHFSKLLKVSLPNTGELLQEGSHFGRTQHDITRYLTDDLF